MKTINVLFLLTLCSLALSKKLRNDPWLNAFSQCYSASLIGTMIYTACEVRTGGDNSTSIDLSYCVTNDDGKLRKSINGDYHKSCTDCIVRLNSLRCSCRRRDGSIHVDSYVYLGEVMGNDNGTLKCF